MVALAVSVGAFVVAIGVAYSDADEAPGRRARATNVASPVRARPSTTDARPPTPAKARRTPRPAAPRGPLPIRSARSTAREDEEAERARALDELALARFDAAFARETRDEPWAAATEHAITEAIAATNDALRIEGLECRAALCRVTLVGDREALPSTPPFDGIAWWSGPDEGRATLLVVRDDAEPPLPRDDELG